MTPNFDEDFLAYRRVVAAQSDVSVWWWYLGTTNVILEGGPNIPVSHPETLMVYDVETISSREFKIHWREVGYFRDPITGDVAQSWFNPITAETVDAPSSFEEGPATYTFEKSEGQVQATLQQNHAIVRKVEITKWETESLIAFRQTEHKVRSFPDKDGKIKDPEEGGAGEARTTLNFSARKPDVLNAEIDFVPVSGTYDFHLNALPEWMGFREQTGSTLVQGVIAKGRPGEKVNEQAYERLAKLYPDFFR